MCTRTIDQADKNIKKYQIKMRLAENRMEDV